MLLPSVSPTQSSNGERRSIELERFHMITRPTAAVAPRKIESQGLFSVFVWQ